MKYAVNEAGISALQNISTVLMTSVADLFEKTSQLQTISSDNEDSLGPHKASLNQAIMEIYIGLKESTESISALAASAKDIAEAYQEIIDNDYLSSTAGKPVNTKYLRFEEIKPIEIDGKYGGYTKWGEVIVRSRQNRGN